MTLLSTRPRFYYLSSEKGFRRRVFLPEMDGGVSSPISNATKAPDKGHLSVGDWCVLLTRPPQVM